VDAASCAHRGILGKLPPSVSLCHCPHGAWERPSAGEQHRRSCSTGKKRTLAQLINAAPRNRQAQWGVAEPSGIEGAVWEEETEAEAAAAAAAEQCLCSDRVAEELELKLYHLRGVVIVIIVIRTLDQNSGSELWIG
jgi:hypothetical protein